MSDNTCKFMGRLFVRNKYDGLDGKTKVSYSEQNSTFQVVCDQTGIIFKGEMPIFSQADLQDFAEFVSVCWTEHKKLAPKLMTSLSGH